VLGVGTHGTVLRTRVDRHWELKTLIPPNALHDVVSGVFRREELGATGGPLLLGEPEALQELRPGAAVVPA